jgi:hypothetical protein
MSSKCARACEGQVGLSVSDVHLDPMNVCVSVANSNGAATSLRPPHSIVGLADLRWIPPETWAPENMTLIEDFRGSAFDSDRFEGWMGVAAGLCVLAL